MGGKQNNIRRGNGYVALAEAIVELAVSDYRIAGKRLAEKRYRRTTTLLKDIKVFNECTLFFLNNCNGLTGAGGEKLIEQIERRYEIDRKAIEEIHGAKILKVERRKGGTD